MMPVYLSLLACVFLIEARGIRGVCGRCAKNDCREHDNHFWRLDQSVANTTKVESDFVVFCSRTFFILISVNKNRGSQPALLVLSVWHI